MFDKIRPFFTMPPRRPTSPLGAGMSDEDEPAIPAFQQAWKQGATFEDMFGPSPFTLHGSVGRTGADNHRPDVAKVETFLGDAGYYKPLTNDGPSGWHNANLDSAIRSFQKDKGLEVDGLLKPNGPTITKIGGVLGGGHTASPTPKEPSHQPPMLVPSLGPATPDPFPDHTIAPAGAEDHDRYARALVNDSDPSKTAAFLKNVTEWYGDRGSADVADLLGRFQKVDAGKARNLQEELFRQSGRRIPFRVAPIREAETEESTEQDTVRLPQRNPWGSTEGANPWEADSMAKVLLDRSDYKDAVKHFAGEFKRAPEAARPYTAAIYETMAAKSPAQALQFARQMAAGGLAMAEDEPNAPAPSPEPPAPGPEEEPDDKPDDQPDDKPDEGDENEECERLKAAFEEKQAAMLELRDKLSAEETLLQSIEADIEDLNQQKQDIEELMVELALQGKGDYDVGKIPKDLRYLFRIFPAMGMIRGVVEATNAAMEYYHNEVIPKRSALEKERQEVLSRKQELESALDEAASAADAAADEFESGCGRGAPGDAGPMV
ncbi:MAG: peptidoglycan-binding protein [Magnetospirillum gryphiswaldense]|nr:peptidoglycan-binding protein [Magnetospirillum gryphiswaldense]